MLVLAVLTGVDGMDPDWLSGWDLPAPEETLVLAAALDAVLLLFLTCLLLRLVTELLSGHLRLPLPGILLQQGRQLLFDHASRAPPSCL